MLNQTQTVKIAKQKNCQMEMGGLFPDTLAQRKKDFLRSIVSPSGKTKYKRYVGAPIRYAGGKSLAVGLVIERIPDDTERVVSPFLGGGSVEVAIAKELNYMNKGCKKIGLVEICDVCGKPLLKGQKLGKKRSNDALCHENCLYYKIGGKIVTREEFRKYIFK